MASAERLTIASLNTQMSRTVKERSGLKPLDGVDVLMLQEVRMDSRELVWRIKEETGLAVAQYDTELGLAIAVPDSYVIYAHHQEFFKRRGLTGRMLLRAAQNLETSKFRLRGRGLIGVTVETPAQNRISVATTHPTVPLKLRARNKQVRAMGHSMPNTTYPLVLAGDMNHWPGPRKVDRQMYIEAGLTPVDLSGVSTFDISLTRYACLGKAANFGLNFNGQLDAMLYRGIGLTSVAAELVTVPSDHRAVVGTFNLESQYKVL